MGILNVASGKSLYRGYEYAKEKKVLSLDEIDDGIYQGIVSGSNGEAYEIFLDVAHPRRSKCNCPHANGKMIVCKHIAAAYFTAYPMEADQYIKELEEYWEEEEARQQKQGEQLVRYVRSMKKAELQEALLQLLYEGPDWQYERFIRYHLEV